MEKKNLGTVKPILLFLIVALYFASAFFLPEYWRYLLLIMSIMVIVAQGLNVMIGFAGIFSFGQPGFMAFGAYLPYSPLATKLGFVPLPPVYWALLLATLVCYVGLTQVIKMWLIRKAWV